MQGGGDRISRIFPATADNWKSQEIKVILHTLNVDTSHQSMQAQKQQEPESKPLSLLSSEELSQLVHYEVLDGSVDLENFNAEQAMAFAENMLDSLFAVNYDASEFVKVNEVLLQSTSETFDERKYVAAHVPKL